MSTIKSDTINNLVTNNNSNNQSLNSNQPGVLGIIQNENIRLDQKKLAVNNMKFEQERIIQMNRNLQERTAAFNQIIIIIFFTLAIVVAIIFVGRFVPGYDSFVVLSIIIVLSIGICYSIYLYLLFTQRQVNNYDLLNLYSPAETPQSTNNTDNTLLDSTNSLTFNNNGYCVGSGCCEDPSKWNGNACISSFATLTDAYGYSDYISSQTETVSLNKPVSLMPVQPSAQSCQNPIAYPSQYPRS